MVLSCDLGSRMQEVPLKARCSSDSIDCIHLRAFAESETTSTTDLNVDLALRLRLCLYNNNTRACLSWHVRVNIDLLLDDWLLKSHPLSLIFPAYSAHLKI